MRDKIKARIRSSRWKHSESGKVWIKSYRQRLDVKARQAAYLRVWRTTPKGKKCIANYIHRPEIKARAKTLLEKPERKELRKNWFQTKKGVAYLKRQRESLERQIYLKAHNRAWSRTPWGKAYYRVSNNRRRTLMKKGDLMVSQWLEIQNISPICNMCGRFVECENLTLDHIIPLSKGGEHTKNNIQTLCKSCNSSKHDKIPQLIHSHKGIMPLTEV